MMARVNSSLSQFVADGFGLNPLVWPEMPEVTRRFHHHNMALHSCGNANIAHDHEPKQYFPAARKMGIAAARLAFAWFQMPLLLYLAFAVLSGTTGLSGSWLGGRNSDGSVKCRQMQDPT